MKTLKYIYSILLLVVNVSWIGFFTKLFYDYHFTNKLFLVMLPDWLLILNFTIGIIGVVIGIAVIKERMKIIHSILIEISLLVAGSFLCILTTM